MLREGSHRKGHYIFKSYEDNKSEFPGSYVVVFPITCKGTLES